MISVREFLLTLTTMNGHSVTLLRRYISIFILKTNNQAFLQKAYDIALNNVNQLIDEQHTMNSSYLGSKGRDGVCKEREQYNKMLKEHLRQSLLRFLSLYC